MSDETRLRIVILLAQQELCVCELSGILEVLQPKVSKNLSKLRAMNLVIDEKKQKFVFYKLKTENLVLINTVENIIDNMEEFPQLLQDKARLICKDKYLNECNISSNKSKDEINAIYNNAEMLNN